MEVKTMINGIINLFLQSLGQRCVPKWVPSNPPKWPSILEMETVDLGAPRENQMLSAGSHFMSFHAIYAISCQFMSFHLIGVPCIHSETAGSHLAIALTFALHVTMQTLHQTFAAEEPVVEFILITSIFNGVLGEV